MDIERTLETQRLKLLRIVAGLLVLVGVLAVGPVSRRFSVWTLGFVGSILSRAEAAARYMTVTQACLMADRCGLGVDRRQIAVPVVPVIAANDTVLSTDECRRRLRVLRATLSNLPRHALRLLRQIARRIHRSAKGCSPRVVICRSAAIQAWQHATKRIERPPDKRAPISSFLAPPPVPRREAQAVGPPDHNGAAFSNILAILPSRASDNCNTAFAGMMERSGRIL